MPSGVVTVTSTVPVPAGLVAVIWVLDTTSTLVAATPPKSTAVAPLKFVPVIVTVVPPFVRAGIRRHARDGGRRRLGEIVVGVTAVAPPGVTTVTATVPAAPAGLTAVIVPVAGL